MTWTIKGRRDGLQLGISDTGNQICHGSNATQICSPAVLNDFSLVSRIEHTECTWTICMATEHQQLFAADMLTGIKPNFLERVQSSPNESRGISRFFDSPDTVTFLFVVPLITFLKIIRLIELVLASHDLSYTIGIDFIGFPVPHAEQQSSTEKEFIAGRPIYFDGFSLMINANLR